MSDVKEQIRFCTSRDGTRIAYATCGKGPPVVWVASWMHHTELDWQSLIWAPRLALLTRRRALVRYDWRGCGLSDREGIEFSFERYIEDLEAVVEAAHLKSFALLGHEAAGAVCIAYAVRHPERVSHLVLCGCPTRGRFARSTTSVQVEEAETRMRAIEFGWNDENPAFGQFLTACHIPDASALEHRAFNDLIRSTTSPANAVQILRSFFTIDVLDLIPQVECPTLVLHARKDGIIPFAEGRAIAAAIPGARLLPLESRNHTLIDSEPAWQQFAEALDDFLPRTASQQAPSAAFLHDLTAREHQVLELVAQGLDNMTIGRRLGISERTARNHISTILSKLGVNRRAKAIVQAREAGYGQKASC
jgi:pimeloyl-ACP methyl ester carboxylesterase/DNA-binding CsgD family transcriptional regulator